MLKHQPVIGSESKFFETVVYYRVVLKFMATYGLMVHKTCRKIGDSEENVCLTLQPLEMDKVNVLLNYLTCHVYSNLTLFRNVSFYSDYYRNLPQQYLQRSMGKKPLQARIFLNGAKRLQLTTQV